MGVKKKINSSNSLDFFSKEMIITKKSLNENQLKYLSKTVNLRSR